MVTLDPLPASARALEPLLTDHDPSGPADAAQGPERFAAEARAFHRAVFDRQPPSQDEPQTARLFLVAQGLNVTVQTLRNWVARGQFPGFIEITPQSALFSLEKIAEWAESRYEAERPKVVKDPRIPRSQRNLKQQRSPRTAG